MQKEVFYNLNQLTVHCNVYIKNPTINDMEKRTCLYGKINEENGSLMLCDYVINENRVNNKRYIHRYGEMSNMNILNTDDLSIEHININNELLKSEQMTLRYDDNIKNYMGIVGDATTDKCDKKRIMSVLVYTDKLEKIDIDIVPPCRASLFKVVALNHNFYMKFMNNIYRFAKLYSIGISIDVLTEQNTKSRSVIYPFRLHVTDSSPNVKFIKYELDKDNKPILFIDHNGKIIETVLPCILTASITDVQFHYSSTLNIMELVDEKCDMTIELFDSSTPCLNNDILKSVYEAFFNYTVDTLPVEFIGNDNSNMYSAVCNKALYINRPYIVGNLFDEFPQKYSNKLLFNKLTPGGYNMYPFSLIAGKSNDSAPTMLYFNNKYFFYERGNPLPGARNIEVSTSFDMKEWSKLVSININKFCDPTNDNYYTPNVMHLADTKYLIAITPYYHRDNNAQHHHRILLSKNGTDFDIVGNINNMKQKQDHHDLCVVSNGLIIDDKNTSVYFCNDTELMEYKTEPYGLFYLSTDNIGSFETKLLKVKNKNFSFGYKCKNKNGCVNIKLIDKYNNMMIKDIIKFEGDTYTVKTVSWKTENDNFDKDQYEYIKLRIELNNANLYWIEGEFIDTVIEEGYSHIIYKINDYFTSWFDKAEEKYHNINVEQQYGYKIKYILGDIVYNKEHTCAYVNVRLVNGDDVNIILWNAENDIMVKLGESLIPFELKEMDPEGELKNIIQTTEGVDIIRNIFQKNGMHENIKIVPSIYKRSICIFDYKLIQLPKCCV
jgi:hypothetical protein